MHVSSKQNTCIEEFVEEGLKCIVRVWQLDLLIKSCNMQSDTSLVVQNYRLLLEYAAKLHAGKSFAAGSRRCCTQVAQCKHRIDVSTAAMHALSGAVNKHHFINCMVLQEMQIDP